MVAGEGEVIESDVAVRDDPNVVPVTVLPETVMSFAIDWTDEELLT